MKEWKCLSKNLLNRKYGDDGDTAVGSDQGDDDDNSNDDNGGDGDDPMMKVMVKIGVMVNTIMAPMRVIIMMMVVVMEVLEVMHLQRLSLRSFWVF